LTISRALAQVQSERPEVTVSFTMMIQGEDYGMVPDLGVKVLENAKENGVRVDIVNAMTMEYYLKVQHCPFQRGLF